MWRLNHLRIRNKVAHRLGGCDGPVAIVDLVILIEVCNMPLCRATDEVNHVGVALVEMVGTTHRPI